MGEALLNRKTGIAPVISSVILTADVLTIGCGLWYYSLGATSVIADNYVHDNLELVDDIIERFDIEHASYRSDNDSLKVWIFNHGEVDITVDVYVTANSTINLSKFEVNVTSGKIGTVTFDFTSNPLDSDTSIAIKAHSRRQNDAYKTYIVT